MHPQLLTVVDKEVLKTWTPDEWTKWRIEPKFDGYRLTYHKGEFLSRTGKPFHNLGHIAKDLAQFPGFTFDGELYGDKWEDAAAARRSKNGGANALKFCVFDMLTDGEWREQWSGRSFAQRRLELQRLFGDQVLHHTHTPPQHKVDNYDSFENIHLGNLSNGCDGTVLKREDSLYEFKRTKTWLKVKPVVTFDCKVVGLKEGTGKYKGILGALEVLPLAAEMPLEFGVVPTSFVSGMDDEQRRRWWARQQYIIGKTVEVEARGVHKSGKLIEPRFIRVRNDK